MNINRRKKLVIIAILISLAGIIVVSTIPLKLILPRSLKINEISEICGIEFPHNSTLLNSYYTMLGQELYAKIEMDKDDAQRWSTSLAKLGDVSTAQRICNLPNGDFAWWNPRAAHKFVAIFARPHYHFPVRVLVDLDDDKRVTVYLYRTR